MTIDGVSGSSSIMNGSLDPSALTPDALLSYCSASLNGLDTQIKNRMSDQQETTAKQKAAGEAIGLFQTWTCGVPPHEKDSNGAWQIKDVPGTQGLAGGLITQYNNNSDPAVRDAIRAGYKAVTGNDLVVLPDGQAQTYPPGGVPLNPANVTGLTNEQWQQLTVTPAKQAQDNLSKGSDMAMIEIQSLVSKRQLCIQLTTQIMQAANDGTKGIAGNIGH